MFKYHFFSFSKGLFILKNYAKIVLMTLNDYLEKIEKKLSEILPENAGSTWLENSFGRLDACVDSSHAEPLLNPCRELFSLGGKRWRPLLLVLMARLSSKNPDSAEKIALSLTPLVEFSHTASLIHDDLEDKSESRRGKPCAYLTYGLDVAVNSACWLYFEAATAIKNAELNDSEKVLFYETYLEELRRLHLGQAMDIKWHNENKTIPTKDEYLSMVKNKTGTLSRLAVKIGVISGGATLEDAETCGKFAENIGLGFQIIDDVINLTSGNPGKKRGDDIVEGKKSLPVLLHLEKNPGELEKLSALFERARNEGIESPAVEEAISILEKSGAIYEAEKTGWEAIKENLENLVNRFGKEKSTSEEAELIRQLFSKMAGK